jgi:hypothetical protein
VAGSGEAGPKSAVKERPKSPLLLAIRIAFGVLTPVALVTGFLGLRQFLNGLTADQVHQLGNTFRDIVYYDLQLFVLSSQPLTVESNYPTLLDIARFAAPLATALALAEAAHALFATQYERWRDRRRRGHSIIVGATPVARAIVAALEEAGERIDWIVSGTAEALIGAGVRAAAVVYVCGDDSSGDSTLNVAWAQTAATLRRRVRSPLRVYAQVSDPNLALALRARWLGQDEVDRAVVDFFTVDVLAARACLRDTDVPPSATGPHAITISGWGVFGRSLLIEYAQRWQVRSAGQAGKVRVTVVGARPEQVADLVARWDVIDEMCSITTVAPEQAPWLADGPLPHRTFICDEDERLALTTALTASRLWRGGRDSVVLRLGRLALPGDPTIPNRDVASTLKLIDEVGGCLRIVSVTELACKPEVLAQDIVERLAQAIHRRYLLAQSTAGTAMHSTAAMRWWEELEDDLQDANRHPARDIGRKLGVVRATVAPRTADTTEPVRWTARELEVLARDEHERWFRERTKSGWVYGTPRDDRRKHHPSLLPWDELPESEREKDRDSVRDLPRVLADAGLQVVRLEPIPAPAAPLPRHASLNA